MNKKQNQIRPTKTIQKFLLSQNLDAQSYLEEEDQPNGMLYLDKNENPFTPSLEYLPSLELANLLKNYPDPNSITFLNQLSQNLGIPSTFLLAGSGSDELLDLIMKTYATRKIRILSVSPTFSMYKFYAKICGAKYESIPLKLNLDKSTGMAQFYIDQDLFIQKATSSDIIILARPNNPDGTLIPLNFIKQLLKLKKLIIIDEAYIDFSAGSNLMNLLKTYNNLIITRTFSKAYSLAGLRLGYIITNPSIKNVLTRVKSPYNVNNLALQFGSQLLKKYDEITANIERVISIREDFYKELCSLRKKNQYFFIHPSEANFILIRFQDSEMSKSLYSHFLKNQIKVRKFVGELSNCLRISIGTSLQMKKVIKTLKLYFEVN
ncbi:MAG: pyridoxal phosphate-dependent aminotransferase [Promethearchaeota archaeon]